MVIDFIAMASVGFGAAGIFLLLRKLLGDRLPKWALPAVIGAAMLTFSVWSEYSWFKRVTQALPAEVVVVLAPTELSAFRPWTLLFPPKTRFLALDTSSLLTSETIPTIRQGTLFMVQRWGGTERLPEAFDCAAWRHASLVDGATVTAEGQLSGSVWLEAKQDDPLMLAACPAK
jgi:hypothetical protein